MKSNDVCIRCTNTQHLSTSEVDNAADFQEAWRNRCYEIEHASSDDGLIRGSTGQKTVDLRAAVNQRVHESNKGRETGRRQASILADERRKSLLSRHPHCCPVDVLGKSSADAGGDTSDEELVTKENRGPSARKRVRKGESSNMRTLPAF